MAPKNPAPPPGRFVPGTQWMKAAPPPGAQYNPGQGMVSASGAPLPAPPPPVPHPQPAALSSLGPQPLVSGMQHSDPYGLQAAGVASVPQAGNPLGGLDLMAINRSGQAETGTRIANQKSLLQAYLDDVLGLQSGEIGAMTERDKRLQDFERGQAAMRTAAAQWAADRAASGGEAERTFASDEARKDREQKDWVREQTQGFELGYAAGPKPPEEQGPQLSDFGAQTVDPNRGGLLAPQMQTWAVQNPDIYGTVMQEVARQVHDNADPGAVMVNLSKMFGPNPESFKGSKGKKYGNLQEVASYALWQLTGGTPWGQVPVG